MLKLFLIIFLFSCSDGFAKEFLTLGEAVELAIKNNPELKQLYYSKLVSDAKLGMAKSDNYPTLDLGAGGKISHQNIIDGEDETTSSADIDLALNWLLYDFGEREAGIESAKQSLEAVSYTYNARVMDLVFNVVDAYYYLLRSSDQLQASKKSLTQTKLSFDIASKKYELGFVALNDKLQTETQYLRTEIALNDAIGEEQVAKGKLLLLLNEAPNTEIAVKLPDEKLIEDNILEQDILELMEKAISDRFEIASKKAELSYYISEEERAEKSDLPSLSLISNLGVGTFNSRNETSSYSGAIGLQVRVPLFTGYYSTYDKLRAREETNIARKELEEIVAIIKENVWKAWYDYQTAKKNYSVSHRLFTAAKQNESVALGAYQAGKGSMLNLITAQAALIEARNEKTASLYDFLTTRSRLLKETGFHEFVEF